MILFYVIFIIVDKCLGQDLLIQQKFRFFEVSPNVVLYPPGSDLTVRYANNVNVQCGNVLSPSQLKTMPEVACWSASTDRLYSLILIDPDAPSRLAPTEAEYLHWLVINIPGHNLAGGNTIFEYVPPQPPHGTGVHRYVFLLFEQPGLISPNLLRELKNRPRFSTEHFAAEHKLGNAVAGNFFLTQHEGSQQ